jgi:hypothetical protein
MKKKIFLALVVLLGLASLGGATTADKEHQYYQEALQAYLSGDLDQAILLDSKALEINPRSPKASALLNVLISEKDMAGKTVIWIGGKPSVVDKEAVPAQAPAAPKVRTVHSGSGVDNKKLAELEARIQAIALLMDRGAQGQYQELKDAQIETTKRLEGMGGRGLGLLSILAILLSLTALWMSWKTRREQKRQRHIDSRSGHREGQEKVVHFRRM